MRRWPLAALLALAAAPASAQVVIGGAGRPSVEVDLGAIHGGGAPSTGLTPGYDRPLLIPPVDTPKLTPPRQRASKPAPTRKPSAKPARTVAQPKAEPKPEVEAEPKPEPRLAAPAPQPPPPAAAAPPAVAAAPPVASAPVASAPAPFPPSPSAPVASSAPPPPPAAPAQVFSAAPAGTPPQAFAPAPPKALAPSPPAPAEPAAEAPRAPTQMAALPPADGDLTVEFQGDGAELGPGAAQQLRSLAARLKDQPSRLQLKAYASGGADGPSRAKRVSLSRGLAVRSFLIDQGMRSTQIDVRALGLVRDGGPEDRVDVVVLEQ